MFTIIYFNLPYSNSIYFEYTYSILLLNIFSYVGLTFLIFNIFFLFRVTDIQTLNNFKAFKGIPFALATIILVFFSLAGVPPLFGFLAKFLFFYVFISSAKYFYFIIFLVFNFFVMFFYAQNIRFLINKDNLKKSTLNYIFNVRSLFLINLMNYLNIFSIFFIETILIYINFLSSFILLT